MKRLRDACLEEGDAGQEKDHEEAVAVIPVDASSAQTPVEKQLLADLVLARDALEKMKQGS